MGHYRSHIIDDDLDLLFSPIIIKHNLILSSFPNENNPSTVEASDIFKLLAEKIEESIEFKEMMSEAVTSKNLSNVNIFADI